MFGTESKPKQVLQNLDLRQIFRFGLWESYNELFKFIVQIKFNVIVRYLIIQNKNV